MPIRNFSYGANSGQYHAMQAEMDAHKRAEEARRQAQFMELFQRRQEAAQDWQQQNQPSLTASQGLANGIQSMVGGGMSYLEGRDARRKEEEAAQSHEAAHADAMRQEGGAPLDLTPPAVRTPQREQTDHGRQLMMSANQSPATNYSGGLASGLQSVAGGMMALDDNGLSAIDRVVRAIERRRAKDDSFTLE